MTEQYKALLRYVTKNIFAGDEFAAEMICEDVQGICQFEFSVQEVFEVFKTCHGDGVVDNFGGGTA